jgi:UDP:flavonoid glycosyltransferase YjiC (YdhE family)
VKPIEHLSNIVDTHLKTPVIPDVLHNFVSTKTPLVYMSFGSFKIPKSLNLQIIKALLNQGYRVIYHGKLDTIIQDENLLIYTTFISHEWIIPKCSMIVSSGSYCMTSIANYHGVPIVHVPILLEQVFWAKLYAYNTSTKYIHRDKKYKIQTLENLVNKIQDSPKVKEYTRNLASSVQKNQAVTKLYKSIKNKIL